MDKPFPKINMFTHLMPEKYRKALYRKAQQNIYSKDIESHHNANRLYLIWKAGSKS